MTPDRVIRTLGRLGHHVHLTPDGSGLICLPGLDPDTQKFFAPYRDDVLAHLRSVGRRCGRCGAVMLGEEVVCWQCAHRPCMKCGEATGSVYLVVCPKHNDAVVGSLRDGFKLRE